MNSIGSFFRKYGAVPANDAGPIYSQATDDALVIHANADCKAWDENEDARPAMTKRMIEQRNELFKRSCKYKSFTPEQKWVRNAWWKLCDRVGIGP